ncbi:MAG: tRNA (adenosine(37)-N6)-threonylcarbamoyltransferase complex dimerization subunit type 1 TsaB [Deltaproteobacteria bacterium]|nr:tRNA (adenosine(37)-N6)-threonylcarbamoyltransferase complex dimerization subunit type 1 TsaB [Deltaproteobacteria bacterium]
MSSPFARVLALETSTTLGGLALLEEDEVRAKLVIRTGGAHSRRLLPLLEELLDQEGLKPHDLHLLVASLGPGSFTGLRVGMATIKGLALAASLPVAGASSLATLAHAAAPCNGLVAPTLDARKGEVYAALYRFHRGQRQTVLAEAVVPPESWAQRVAAAAGGEPVLWLGSGARLYREALAPCSPAGSWLLGAEFESPDPAHLALLGRERALAEGPADLATLEPNYLRPGPVLPLNSCG